MSNDRDEFQSTGKVHFGIISSINVLQNTPSYTITVQQDRNSYFDKSRQDMTRLVQYRVQTASRMLGEPA